MQFSLPQVAGALFAVVTAAAAATWYVREEQIDVLKQQVELCQDYEGMSLQELSDGALDAVSMLRVQLSKLESNDGLRREIAALKGELVKEKERALSQEKIIDSDKMEIEGLKSQIMSLFSDYQYFSLEANEPRKLFSAKYVVTVDSVREDGVWVYINNDISSMAIGNYKELKNDSLNCKMYLEGIDDKTKANFSVLCDKT